MARGLRVDVGGLVYHVINRANGRFAMFESDSDYYDFIALLAELPERFGMHILAYAIMPNHWHLLLQTTADGDLSKSRGWLSNAHTRRYHARTRTIGTGHLYQGRYKSFIVDNDAYLLTALKYIERNPVRALLCNRAEEWLWGSACRILTVAASGRLILANLPTRLPPDYISWINVPEPAEDLKSVRRSTVKGIPFGRASWRDRMIVEYNLTHTTRAPGRPSKNCG